MSPAHGPEAASSCRSCPAIVNLVELRSSSLVSHLRSSTLRSRPCRLPRRAPIAYSCRARASVRRCSPTLRQPAATGGRRGRGRIPGAGWCGRRSWCGSRAAAPVRLAADQARSGSTAGSSAAANARGRRPLTALEGDGVLTVTASTIHSRSRGDRERPARRHQRHRALRMRRRLLRLAVARRGLPRDRAPLEAGPRGSRHVPATTVARPALRGAAGIRLDADMGTAIQKLARMQEVIKSLPGRDCGACGAPTCAALAEDIVMERARMEAVPVRHRRRQGGRRKMRLQELARVLSWRSSSPRRRRNRRRARRDRGHTPRLRFGPPQRRARQRPRGRDLGNTGRCT